MYRVDVNRTGEILEYFVSVEMLLYKLKVTLLHVSGKSISIFIGRSNWHVLWKNKIVGNVYILHKLFMSNSDIVFITMVRTSEDHKYNPPGP